MDKGDTIGFAVDLDAGIVEIYKNGSLEYTTDPTSWVPTSDSIVFGIEFYAITANMECTIMQDGAPDGYLPVCTNSLPDPLVNPKDNFSAVTYTGNSGTQSIDTGFEPGLTWHKSRNSKSSHALFDSVRGGDKVLSSVGVQEEQTASGMITEFTSEGFTMGSDPTQGWINQSGNNYISWNFRAGDTEEYNYDGSTMSRVSANKDMGFSVVSFLGGPATPPYNMTVGHGLGNVPTMIIMKNRVRDYNWDVYQVDACPGGVGRLVLNTSAGYDSVSLPWGGTEPTDSVFTYNNGFGSTEGDAIIAYCFTNTEMIQSGLYVGNGSDDGTFISLPFKPAFLMVKGLISTLHWHMFDNGRYPSNPTVPIADYNDGIAADLPIITVGEGAGPIDILSNGFKITNPTGQVNNTNTKFLYLAISDQSFKHSRGR